MHGVQVVGGSNPLVPTMRIQGTLNLVGVPFFVAFNFFLIFFTSKKLPFKKLWQVVSIRVFSLLCILTFLGDDVMRKVSIVDIKQVPPKNWEEALSRFVTLKKAQQYAPKTIEGYVENVRAFYRRYGEKAWGDSCRDCLLNYLAQDGIAPSTYNVRLKTLRPFFAYCVLEGGLASNPTDGLKFRHEEPRMVDHSLETLQAMVAVMDTTKFTGLRDKALFFLSLDSGIRPSEALQLKVEDIDTSLCRCTIRGTTAKTRRNRVVFFSMPTAELVKKLIDVRPPEWDVSRPVFCSSYGEPWETREWTRQLDRYAKKAGVKRFSAYDLRHQHAIQFLRNGGDVMTLSHEMGHANLTMTQKYLALADEDIQKTHAKASPINNLFPKRKRLGRI